jgi:hypothetical protein
MNIDKGQVISAFALCTALTAFSVYTPSVAAVTYCEGFATLTYTIDSIANITDPNSEVGPTVLGTFEQLGEPDSFVFTTGDGTVTALNPSAGPLALNVGDTFSYTFSTSGEVNNGTVDAMHAGRFALNLDNPGPDDFQVGVTLDYQLSATVGGQSAASTVGLDYFNHDGTHAGGGSAFAQIPLFPTYEVSGTSGLLAFALSSGGSASLSADVTISGNLEAVPVPAAVWLFGSAICGFGLLKRRSRLPVTT